MGYRGKLREQQQARLLRGTGLPLAEIAARLGVSRSSVSLWVRDIPFDPLPRPPRGRRREPNALQRRRQSCLRVALYLHEGLDLAAAVRFWSEVTGIPASQFGKPYRALAIPPSAAPSICMAAWPSDTVAAPPTERSWGWSAHC